MHSPLHPKVLQSNICPPLRAVKEEARCERSSVQNDTSIGLPTHSLCLGQVGPVLIFHLGARNFVVLPRTLIVSKDNEGILYSIQLQLFPGVVWNETRI